MDYIKSLIFSVFGFLTVIMVQVMWILLTAFFVMLAWNYCMPLMFGLPEVGFWCICVFMLMVRLIFPDITYKERNR